MTKNTGTIDRVVRTVVGAGALAGGIALGLSTVGGVVLLVVAVVALGTAAVGFCPLYRLFGLSTCPVAR